jgi:peptide/nickel transport system ATP-binding protein
VPPLLPVGSGRVAACWGYSDRPDRPVLGSVLDAYGARPPVDESLLAAVEGTEVQR